MDSTPAGRFFLQGNASSYEFRKRRRCSGPRRSALAATGDVSSPSSFVPHRNVSRCPTRVPSGSGLHVRRQCSSSRSARPWCRTRSATRAGRGRAITTTSASTRRTATPTTSSRRCSGTCTTWRHNGTVAPSTRCTPPRATPTFLRRRSIAS